MECSNAWLRRQTMASNRFISTKRQRNSDESLDAAAAVAASLASLASLITYIKCILFSTLLTTYAFNMVQSAHLISMPDNENHIEAMINMFGGENGKRTLQGIRIIEGDIALPEDEFNELQDRKAVNERMYRWPSAIVPYIFHSSITKEERTVIEIAMQEYHNETCIRFKPKVNAFDQLFIRLRSDQEGCWSLLGRQISKYRVGQDVSIGKGCAAHHVVVHELGHAIGFHHEQSRSDRDSMIHINFANVESSDTLQFNKEEDENFGVPYDVTSVMQYPSWAFSKEMFVKNTIVTQDPKYQRLLGKSDRLSFRDKKTANLLYNCNKDCPNKDTRCLNDGYLSAYRHNGQPCVCVCPPTATGKHCETVVNNDYYDAIDPLPCGGNVTQEGYIQTPDYPRRTRPYQSCAWIITAPKNKMVRLTVEGFEFAPRFTRPGTKVHNTCFNESVEFRLNDRYNGQIYCGTDITAGSAFTSRTPTAIVIVIADQWMVGKGLRAKVQFIDKRRVKPFKQRQRN